MPVREVMKMLQVAVGDDEIIECCNMASEITNMAKAGISPKSLQYLMGHADIATTLGYYTHYKFNDVEKEVRELEEKMKKAR